MDRIEDQPATNGNRGRGRWCCRAAVVSAAALALAVPLNGRALAADHDFHGGGAHDAAHDAHGGEAHTSPAHSVWHGGHTWHGGVAWRGGHDRDDWNRDDFGWGGFGSWGPDYSGWYDWNYPGYYASPGYAYRAPSANVWYYCYNPAGYYPYVQQCYGAWQPVPAG